MYTSRRGGRGNGWSESRKQKSVPHDVNSGEGALNLPVISATVMGIESHPKQPHMYRIILKLIVDKSSLVDDEQELPGTPTEEESALAQLDWKDEVDALITGAQSSASEGETLLTVHEDTLVGWRLLKGRELTAEEYETLKADEQKEDAYKTALGMLERKARTTSELSRALKRKGYAPEVVAGCLERLQARRMLDDSAYAKRFTEQRATGQRKGRMLIRQELLQRGVGREDVEEAIGELDGQVEEESALHLARKRWPNIKGNDRERKQKLMAMLLRRGFPSGVVRSAVQQVAASSVDEELESDYDDNDPFDSGYSMEE
ncbi:regulatory protein RecX [Cohnella sp.]|uniref:regulatory protein RecX n=1 Tax=Cohnella sp. TaxID=1883426 RepID=UPI00356A28D2